MFRVRGVALSASGRSLNVLAPVPIHFVDAASRLLPRRARVFMDFIAEAFARDPALNPETGAQRDGPCSRSCRRRKR
jgi:hypothetical protein